MKVSQPSHQSRHIFKCRKSPESSCNVRGGPRTPALCNCRSGLTAGFPHSVVGGKRKLRRVLQGDNTPQLPVLPLAQTRQDSAFLWELKTPVCSSRRVQQGQHPAPSTQSFPAARRVFSTCLHMNTLNKCCSSQRPGVLLIGKIFSFGSKNYGYFHHAPHSSRLDRILSLTRSCSFLHLHSGPAFLSLLR